MYSVGVILLVSKQVMISVMGYCSMQNRELASQLYNIDLVLYYHDHHKLPTCLVCVGLLYKSFSFHYESSSFHSFRFHIGFITNREISFQEFIRDLHLLIL